MTKKNDENRKAKGEPKTPSNPAVARAEEIRSSASRETVEAFVVAFILALLFRAFIAEAFVIPTGSMAPTLMGAHKDLTCDRCGMTFPVGASVERRGPVQRDTVIGGVCPNCRHTNALDLVNERNHATFNGDRILVSKFSYAIGDPERWDVIVFKFPGNPKQNYIKRLVGLPNETLTIFHGDIYARPTGTDDVSQILRKPPHKILAMRHRVSDTKFQSQALLDSKYPARWQPWRRGATEPPQDSWQVTRNTKDGLTAKLTAKNDDQNWLRYFHRVPSPEMWLTADQGLTLAGVNPYSCQAISDFYAYDSYIQTPSFKVYDKEPSTYGRWFPFASQYGGGVFSPEYRSGESLDQFGNSYGYGGKSVGGMGAHWVGDLIFESEVSTGAKSKSLTLMLVEAGVEYTCKIELASGKATLAIGDGQDIDASFESLDGTTSKSLPEAQTNVRAGGRYSIRFANVDDQLTLWVDGKLVEFNGPTTFDARKFRSAEEDRPYYSITAPQDGAPAAIAVQGGEATVHRLKIDRDKYYISTRRSGTMNDMLDYDTTQLWDLPEGMNVSYPALQEILTRPDLWDRFQGWKTRRSTDFELAEDQFFPMGDNSPESQDSRCWARTKLRGGLPDHISKDAYRWSDASYVPRDLLVGKALVVFWPHYWNAPVPFVPNFKRMQLIR